MKTTSALMTSNKVENVHTGETFYAMTFVLAEMECKARGWTLRLAGTSQTGDRDTIMSELRELDRTGELPPRRVGTREATGRRRPVR